MSEIRYTQEGQDRRKEQLDYLRKRLKHVSSLGAGLGGRFWTDLKAVLDGSIEAEQKAQKRGVLDCVLNEKSDSEVRRELASSKVREEAFAFVVDLVEKSGAQADHMKAHIKDLEAQFKVAAEQLA